MIFAARQLHEKCVEQQQDLFMTFVDLTKAFDSVSSDGSWKILAKFSCQKKFEKIVTLFHDGMVGKKLNDGGSSDPFQVTDGVKQKCFLASTLFSLVFLAMLTEAFNNNLSDIPITYWCDKKLFILRRLQAITKIKEASIRYFLVADDCVNNAFTKQKMQREVDQFSTFCENFWLTINTENGSDVSACSRNPLPGTLHFIEETKVTECRKLHLFQQHLFSLSGLKPNCQSQLG